MHTKLVLLWPLWYYYYYCYCYYDSFSVFMGMLLFVEMWLFAIVFTLLSNLPYTEQHFFWINFFVISVGFFSLTAYYAWVSLYLCMYIYLFIFFHTCLTSPDFLSLSLPVLFAFLLFTRTMFYKPAFNVILIYLFIYTCMHASMCVYV